MPTSATRKVNWGVLGASRFALTKSVPCMQKGTSTHILAIASRSEEKARAAAATLGIARAHSSYEALLADPEIEIVYNPLPNHLHVPWSIAALRAGKHVLCEKPIALSAAQARELTAVAEQSGRTVIEAFMVRHHPQWRTARDLIRAGRIGEPRTINCVFSYFNDDPANIRNQRDIGGGALYDIGCYAINTARFLLAGEPARVSATCDRDPRTGIDRLTTGWLDFGGVQAHFSVGTQQSPYQRVVVLGTRGRLEIEIPFNAPPDRPTRLFLDDGRDLFGGGRETIEFPIVDQYALQADVFSRLIADGGTPESPLADSIANMAVIDALFRSIESGRTEAP